MLYPEEMKTLIFLFDIIKNTEPKTNSLAYIQHLFKCSFETRGIP